MRTINNPMAQLSTCWACRDDKKWRRTVEYVPYEKDEQIVFHLSKILLGQLFKFNGR